MQPNACAVGKVKEDMVGKGQDEEQQSPRRRNDLPSEVMEIILPALQVGGSAGLSGLFVGAFAGVVRSSTPKLFALASGIQWFTLGTTFWASRGAVIHAWGKDKVTPRERISASAIAGTVAGATGGLLRGPRNVIPGAIMFALFGGGGQVLYNRADSHNSEVAKEGTESTENSWLNSKWSPMKILSDAEYEHMLQEKLLQVNARIALVDESIEALRVQEREVAAKKNAEHAAVDPPSKV